MLNLFKVELASLGFLRLSLLVLAITNTLISLIESIFGSQVSSSADHSVWSVYVTIIAPVLGLLFIVVVFFDFVMSRVRASDLQDDTRLRFLAISRIELLIIAFMLAYWVLFFVSL